MKILVNRQQGAGLIEILVTVLILATALLVLAALQIRSLQYNQSAYLRSQANILAYDIIDRMRLNRIGLNDYDIALDAAAPGGASLAATDMREWRTTLGRVLPEGKGSIECSNAGICSIGIKWTELNSSGEETEDNSTFNFSTQI